MPLAGVVPTKEDIKKALGVIFPENWGINLGKKIAWLVLSDEDEANNLVSYLSKRGVTVTKNRTISDSQPVVLIQGLDLKTLTSIPPYVESSKVSPPSNFK